jgi:two-component system, OmpR family, response regulator QseB
MDSYCHREDNDTSRDNNRSQVEEGQRILLIDDDEEMGSLLMDVLGDDGYDVVQAANGAEALILLHRETFAAILLDKNMPGLSGMDLLPGLRVICPDSPVILITAFGDAHTAEEGTAKGARGCLFKPFRLDDLRAMLRNAVGQEHAGARGRHDVGS